MKWFRANIRHGARLALLALAIQFVLAFGHHHGAEALAAPSIAVQNSATGATLGKQPGTDNPTATTAAADSGGNATPAPHKDGKAGDPCAICAVMALAGTVLFAEPPVLRLPEAYHFLYLTTDAELNHFETRRIAFQPRAPPAS
jgi:hypothetical protein